MAHHCVYHSEHDLFWNTGLKKDMNMKMTLRSPRAGVVVERFGDKRKYLYKIVENNPLCLIKPCTTLLPLAEISADAKIIGPDGQPVPATVPYRNRLVLGAAGKRHISPMDFVCLFCF